MKNRAEKPQKADEAVNLNAVHGFVFMLTIILAIGSTFDVASARTDDAIEATPVLLHETEVTERAADFVVGEDTKHGAASGGTSAPSVEAQSVVTPSAELIENRARTSEIGHRYGTRRSVDEAQQRSETRPTGDETQQQSNARRRNAVESVHPDTRRTRRLPRGYVADVSGEREHIALDLVWVQKPTSPSALSDRIFNQTLSREFRERYEQRFGQTEIERVFLAPNRTSYYNDAYGVKGTPQEISEERRRFGEFMMRRLAEWHVENYAKTDPSAKAIWEAKERISNLKVEVASFRVDAQYSIAGNILDVKMQNPWVQSKLSLLMNPDQLGPGPIDEALWSVFKSVNSHYAVETRWRMVDGILSLIQYKPIARVWNGSFTTSAAIYGNSTRTPRETLWLLGIGRVF